MGHTACRDGDRRGGPRADPLQQPGRIPSGLSGDHLDRGHCHPRQHRLSRRAACPCSCKRPAQTSDRGRPVSARLRRSWRGCAAAGAALAHHGRRNSDKRITRKDCAFRHFCGGAGRYRRNSLHVWHDRPFERRLLSTGTVLLVGHLFGPCTGCARRRCADDRASGLSHQCPQRLLSGTVGRMRICAGAKILGLRLLEDCRRMRGHGDLFTGCHGCYPYGSTRTARGSQAFNPYRPGRRGSGPAARPVLSPVRHPAG